MQVQSRMPVRKALFPNTIAFPNSSARKRLPHLIENHLDSFWLDESHMTRMNLLYNRTGFVAMRNTSRYYLAMFLLTTSDTLLACTQKCFTYISIDLCFSTLSVISLDDYVLYKAAVSDYTKQGGVTLDELTVNGLLITKYGLAAILLKKEL